MVPLTFTFYFYQGWSYCFHCIIYCLVLHLQTVSGKVQGLSRVQILTLVPTYQDHWDMKAISYMSKKFCKLPCTRTKEYKSCSYKKKRSRKLTKEKRKIEILSFPREKKKWKWKKHNNVSFWQFTCKVTTTTAKGLKNAKDNRYNSNKLQCYFL